MIVELFRVTTDAFAPWIQPLDNNGQILSPWIINDDDVASELVAEWLHAIEYLFTAFKGWFPLHGKLLCTVDLHLFIIIIIIVILMY